MSIFPYSIFTNIFNATAKNSEPFLNGRFEPQSIFNQNVIDDYYINLIINYVEEGKESNHKHLPQNLHSESHRSAIAIWKDYVLMDSGYVFIGVRLIIAWLCH